MNTEKIIETTKKIKSLEEQRVRIENSRNSYIKKSDFIDIISKLNFDTIESAKIHFNTAYEYMFDENERPYIKNYGFDLDIY